MLSTTCSLLLCQCPVPRPRYPKTYGRRYEEIITSLIIHQKSSLLFWEGQAGFAGTKSPEVYRVKQVSGRFSFFFSFLFVYTDSFRLYSNTAIFNPQGLPVLQEHLDHESHCNPPYTLVVFHDITTMDLHNGRLIIPG